jgi:ribonuclease D
VGTEEASFVFDILALGSIPRYLKQILEDPAVVKVFHDFCEDTCALGSQHGVHCDSVFDSQIAHRHINQYSEDPKDQNISLN